MNIKRTTAFAPADRYGYDFSECSYRNGWAQVDTAQDASYFGQWANPRERKFFSYIEGDCTLIEAATDDDFAAYIREAAAWTDRNGWGPFRIDALASPAIAARFRAIGLAHLLH